MKFSEAKLAEWKGLTPDQIIDSAAKDMTIGDEARFVFIEGFAWSGKSFPAGDYRLRIIERNSEPVTVLDRVR